MNKTILWGVLALLFHCCFTLAGEVTPDDGHMLDPLRAELPDDIPAGSRFSSLFDDAELGLSSMYYGRARHANNNGRFDGGGNRIRKNEGEIHVNAFGQRVDLRSGYAWGVLGFDVGGQANLGRGNGWSEVLLHKEGNIDRSAVSLSQAALKTKFALGDIVWETRAGFTPISIGTMGTSGGMFSHAYRGVETKIKFGDFSIGYGWADRFRNEWDDTFRKMYNAWHQNRFGEHGGRRISYVHSLGARYEFGPDKAGFIDAGVGEGKDYRRNAQLAASAPIDLGCFGVLTLTGYGIVAQYRDKGPGDGHTEYHVSGSAQLKRGRWTFMAGIGHTHAPDSGEMQFRMTAWGNSDNRNYIQTWGQLDDFVWDGQNVVKAGFRYELGEKVGLPGVAVGASGMYSWNGKNGAGGGRIAGWEADYYAEYAVREGRMKGFAVGVYAGHLRWEGNDFYGKQNRNDVKLILSYSKSLEGFLRNKGKR